MTYQETLEYLFSMLPAYHRVGAAAYKADLAVTLELDRYFGHPHNRYRTIHVAGTNGKGSVSHMIASVLQEAGYRTGLYTSPHLKDFRERIRVDGEMISEEEVISFIGQHEALISSITPSFFEMTVAMAFDWFARQEVDIAVIETGMGGRLDSTNIITPMLSVITNIGHDHMEFLGDTLAAVAGEKAGIIKRGVPVVIGECQPEISGVFTTRAGMMDAPILFADRHYCCRLEPWQPGTAQRHYLLVGVDGDRSSGCQEPPSLSEGVKMKVSGSLRLSGTTPLPGEVQHKNIQTVAAAVEQLTPHLGLTDDHLVRGVAGVMANTGLMGRWQVLAHDPLTICDTGHNREGLEQVIRQLMSLGRERLHMVIGLVNDKDTDIILPLFPAEAEYYFTRASVPRALSPEVLKSRAAAYGLKGDAWPSVDKALSAALAAAGSDDLVFIGGSTFVVADALNIKG